MAGEVALNQLAPDFELTDFHGNPHRLSDFRGEKHVFLVFNRGFR
jgi:peroxiredoxin